jgi:hypothetical protein
VRGFLDPPASLPLENSPSAQMFVPARTLNLLLRVMVDQSSQPLLQGAGDRLVRYYRSDGR